LGFIKLGNVIYSLEQRNKVTNGGGLSIAITVSSSLCLVESKSWWGHQMKVTKPKYLENKDLKKDIVAYFLKKG